ncbi:MAG: hypothetical protein IPK10_14960 [Bacteroidetes bacterium]|nr:hypothetical protein [Bacteroidota bacterium]
MEAVLISVKKKSDIAFLLDLAKKMGMSAKAFSKAQIEDLNLAIKIEEGMKTESVSKKDILKALSK